MTGNEFEKDFCEILWKLGYWALNIPKNQSGAQPFDVIAMQGDTALAIDCKVCSINQRFPLSRIEDNQWTAMKVVHDRTFAWVGIAVYYDGEIYFYQYSDLESARKAEEKSIPIDSFHLWLNNDDIEKILGRKLL